MRLRLMVVLLGIPLAFLLGLSAFFIALPGDASPAWVAASWFLLIPWSIFAVSRCVKKT